ncbi:MULTISPECIES: hypothetical protein [Lentisalinibacter]|uniref:hypothetical protein n=1 Tax=Lentisalinibacter TaxID=3382081 RepID=UPI003863D2F5
MESTSAENPESESDIESVGIAAETIDLSNEIDHYVRTIDAIAQTLQFTLQASSQIIEYVSDDRKKLLEEYGTIVEEDDEGVRYSVPARHSREIDKATRALEMFKRGSDTLPKSQLVALVSAFDSFLARLARWYFIKVPEALSSTQKQVGLSELLEFESLDVAKEYFLEKEVESLLRESHSKQFVWFESKLNRPLRKNLDIWSEFIEITERRNLLVHTDGTVSRQYLKVCESVGYSVDKDIKPGVRIDVPPKYFGRARAVFFELGVKLGHTIWRVVAPEELERADKALNDLAFNLLVTERFKLARKILDFAVSQKKHSEDAQRRIFIVNQAQAYKWLEKEEEALKILDNEDWSSCGLDFRICVAVLREDYEKAVEFMKAIGDQGPISESAYLTWPVFRNFRENDQFADTFKEIFGHDPIEEVEGKAADADSPADGAGEFDDDEGDGKDSGAADESTLH